MKLIGLSGLEPPTSRLSGVRSNQLSYRPMLYSVTSFESSLKIKQLILSTLSPDVDSLLLSQLLRKEVIQPHLPIRLPCYDFTPIINPTFDSSLLCRLGHRLRVLSTFVV